MIEQITTIQLSNAKAYRDLLCSQKRSKHTSRTKKIEKLRANFKSNLIII